MIAAIYFILASFVAGLYAGASIERGESLGVMDAIKIGVLSWFWPALLAVYVYLQILEKSK